MTGHEYTIEGRPELNVDWKQQYHKQRKDRMSDAIDDYLQDEEVSCRQTYEEMLSCVQEVIDYHRKGMERATVLKSLMMGNRDVTLE